MKYLLAVAVAIIVLCKCVPAHADVNDDFGWAGDTGCVTGLAFMISNPATVVIHKHLDGTVTYETKAPDPFPAEVAMLVFDFAGQRLLRGESLIPSQSSPVGRAEMEEMLTSFAVNQMITIPLACLLGLR